MNRLTLHTAQFSNSPTEDICKVFTDVLVSILQARLDALEATDILGPVDKLVTDVYGPAFNDMMSRFGGTELRSAVTKLRKADDAIEDIRKGVNEVFAETKVIGAVTLSSLTNPFLIASLGIQGGLSRIGINASLGTVIRFLLIGMVLTVIGGAYNFVEMIVGR